MFNYRMLAISALCFSNVLFGQYNPDNRVVTVVTYDIKYLSEVNKEYFPSLPIILIIFFNFFSG